LESSNSPIKCYSVCPGWCSSALGRDIGGGFVADLIVGFFSLLSIRRPADKGAECILHACAEDDLEPSGGLFKECQLDEEQNERLLSMTEEAEKLWSISERVIKELTAEEE